MKRALPNVRSIRQVRPVRVRSVGILCLSWRHFATRRPGIDVVIHADVLYFELPPVLELAKVGHRFGVPLVDVGNRNIGRAYIYAHGARPDGCMAGHIGRAHGDIWVRYLDLWVARLERPARTKLAEIG